MENKAELTTDPKKGKGGIYAVINGITYYYVHEDYDNGGDPRQCPEKF